MSRTRAEVKRIRRGYLKHLKSLTAPACWSWPVPEEAASAAAAIRHSVRPAVELLESWQRGMCAICGTADRALQPDHDHNTGLLRGLLCGSCNVREGRDGQPDVIYAYRERHPALILGLRVSWGCGQAWRYLR